METPIPEKIRRKSSAASMASDSGRSMVDLELFMRKYNLKGYQIWALGITIVIGGQYFSWNSGLVAGFGSYGISILLIGGAYICLTLCTAEITSGLPFTGGSYGYARCALGNYIGFIMGCSETIEYIFYVASSTVSLGQMFTSIFPELLGKEPLIWLIFFVISLPIHIFGKKHFWSFCSFLAILSIFILLMFCFGSLKFVNFSKYANVINDASTNNSWFVGGFTQFFVNLPFASWLFVGIESLKETCGDLRRPKKYIPQGMVACVLTLFATAIFVFFVSVSLPPGIFSMTKNTIPFNAGFQLMFNLNDEDTIRYATILSIPATFATSFGFIMMYGKIIIAMSRSKLIPSFLSYVHPTTRAPIAALIFGSICSFLACLLCYYFPNLYKYLFNICILAAFVGYLCQLIGYVLIRTKYSRIQCDFKSPLGIYGACFAAIVFLFSLISIAGFQDDNYFALTWVLCTYTVFTIYYYAYAKYCQNYSKEEQKIFFKIHIINFNSRKSNESVKQVNARKISSESQKQIEIKQYIPDCNLFHINFIGCNVCWNQADLDENLGDVLEENLSIPSKNDLLKSRRMFDFLKRENSNVVIGNKYRVHVEQIEEA